MSEASEHIDVKVWQHPYPERRYVIGADVAEGLAGGDDSAACVIDAETADQVAEYVGEVDPDEFGLLLYYLGKYYNGAYIGVENNRDLTPIYVLKNLEYENLHYEWVFRGEPAEGRKDKIGWNTNVLTRNKMVADARKALRDGTSRIRSSLILDQMSVFERNRRGKFEHIKGAKDDAIFGWMIALQMLEYMHVADDFRESGDLPQLSDHMIGDPNIGDYADLVEENELDLFQKTIARREKEMSETTMGGLM